MLDEGFQIKGNRQQTFRKAFARRSRSGKESQNSATDIEDLDVTPLLCLENVIGDR